MTIPKLINDVEPMDTVSTVNQIIDDKQDVLVSGTNIKTINNTSILGSGDITISAAPDIDNSTITKNTSDQLQTVAVKDNRSGNSIKTWTGTRAQYDALTTNWYAWTVDNTVYYTTSATPNVGDVIYDSNMQDSGKTVSAVGTGTISWADPITLSVIQQTPSGTKSAYFPYDPNNGGACAYINGNLVQENSTVLVNPNESCVLSVSVRYPEGPYTYYIYVDDVLVGSGGREISYTFSPTESTTIGFGGGMAKK